MAEINGGYPLIGSDDIMSKKAHGTCPNPVPEQVRWGIDRKLADKICAFNRHYAEHSGYFNEPDFLTSPDVVAARAAGKPIEFYDSVTGKLLFTAPIGRTWDEFIEESNHHGWPSFRDPEVNWETVRCLADGETVSIDGTHLGHNIPSGDRRNRYCINLVCVSGMPPAAGAS
eukprot:a841037_761.p1 GENE.a841037_761~~a841037_761.p1  ORF type:complete len:195 (+),score=54.63 a841037_761:72-587(+)